MSACFFFGAVEQSGLDAEPPVRLRNQEVDLGRMGFGLLGECDRHHADDLVIDPCHEPTVERVAVVLPVRQHLRGVRGEIGESHLLVAHESVEVSVRAELRGVVGIQGDRHDQRCDGRFGGLHVSFFRAGAQGDDRGRASTGFDVRATRRRNLCARPPADYTGGRTQRGTVLRRATAESRRQRIPRCMSYVSSAYDSAAER